MNRKGIVVKFSIILTCIVAGLWLYARNQHKIQNLPFENVEALAAGETDDVQDGYCVSIGDVDCLSLKVYKIIDNYSLNNDK